MSTITTSTISLDIADTQNLLNALILLLIQMVIQLHLIIF